jgi:Concanavalin A-like lectin/glucanases superfamily
MNKLIVILLLSTVTCFADNKFVRGKFVSGAMPYVSSLPSNGLLNNLQAYWKMDNAVAGPRVNSVSTNNTLDDSVYNIQGVTGIIGNAAYYDYSFGGTDSALQNYTPTLSLTSGYTISAWLKITGSQLGNFQSAFGVFVGAGGPQTVLDGDGQMYYDKGAPGDNQVTSYPPLDVWFHYVMVFDSNTLVFAVWENGYQIGTATLDANYGPVTEIRAFNAVAVVADQPFNGAIDEVGFWNRPLSASEIAALYNNGAGKPYSLFTH